MAGGFRADNATGTGTGTASSLTLTIPATAQVGDVARIACTHGASSATLTTPTGWTLRSGPDIGGSSNSASWLLTKTIASGDAGASVTLAFSASNRASAQMNVFSGVTETGATFAVALKASASTSNVETSAASVPAGAVFDTAMTLRTGTATQITITVGSPYSTGSNSLTATAGSSAPNMAVATGYELPSSVSSLGGETFASNVNTVGANYASVFPSAGFSDSLALSGGGTVATAGQSLTVTAPMSTSGNGAFGPAGTPAMPGSLARSGAGTAGLSGTPAMPGSLGTAGGSSWSTSVPSGGTLPLVGSGQLVASGSGQLYVFNGPVTYEYAPFQPFTVRWSRLVFEIAYGQTVWRDSTGTWQQQYAPSLDQLAGALDVFAGGRTYHLTDQQLADLIAGGFSSYISLEPMP